MSNSISKCEYLVFRFSSSSFRMVAIRKSLVTAIYVTGITSPTSRFLFPITIAKRDRSSFASQLSILTEKDENPFTDSAEIDEEDVNEATPNFLKIDSDNEEDDIDLDICSILTLSSVCSI